MGTLKVSNLNVKRFVIGGKEYRPFTESEIYSDYFVSDEKYVITQAMLTAGKFNITRKVEDNNIYKYAMRTKQNIISYNVQKTSTSTFVYVGLVNPLDDMRLCYLNNTVVKIQDIIENDGYFTYVLASEFDEVYTQFKPIVGVKVNGSLIPPAISTIDTNINVNYSLIYCDLRDIELEIPSSINTVEFDLYTSLSGDALQHIEWVDVMNQTNVDINSAILVNNEYITLDDGQILTLDSGSKLVIS